MLPLGWKNDWTVVMGMIVKRCVRDNMNQEHIREKVLEIINSDSLQSQIKYAMEYLIKNGIW